MTEICDIAAIQGLFMQYNFRHALASVFILLFFFSKAQPNIHVEHYTLNVDLRNINQKQINGRAVLSVYAQQDSLNQITLDLLKLKVTLVTDSNYLLAFKQSDSTLNIQLHRTLNTGDSVILSILYNGSPTTDASWGGFYFNGNYAYNMGVGFNSNPHSFGRCWFPCVDDFRDKSTYDFHITTDSGYRAICNGLTEPATMNTDNSITWHWHMKHHISAYLASVAVGKYIWIQHDYKAAKKTYPVMFACERKDSANLIASFSNIDKVIAGFESRYGIYPFDRVGYVVVPFNGGAMEHASNIAYPLFAVDSTKTYETLFAHELSHAWWGDWVTCKTEQDMWLNEGWASYSEAIMQESLYGASAYSKQIKSFWTDVLKNAIISDGGNYALDNIPHDVTYGKHVYKKGALMVHSLRNIMGDASFYDACKDYQNTFAQNNANSKDLISVFQKHSHADLNGFYNGFIHSAGACNFRAGALKIDTFGEYYGVELKIREDIVNKTDTVKNIPFNISFYDNVGKAFTFNMTYFQDSVYHFYIPKFLFSKPQYAIIDPKDGLFKARTIQSQLIKSNGIKTFSDAGMNINVQQIQDSVTVYISQNITPANNNECVDPAIHISQQRFWSINGFFNDSFTAQGLFNYTPADDGTFVTFNEDSLLLMYRPDAFSKWEVETNVSLNTGGSKSDKSGRITANKLKKGEYIFGKKGNWTSVPKLLKEQIKVYPNPAHNELYVDLPSTLTNINYRLIDLSGKVIIQKMQETSTSHLQIEIPKLTESYYILEIENAQVHYSEKVWIQ